MPPSDASPPSSTSSSPEHPPAGSGLPSSQDERPCSPQSFGPSDGKPLPSGLDEKHPKGKRKRTAAKDKAILEAAYNSNPKPDKAARLQIVERVSLNEKEVQIWFQNRRQNDRRKSRPLSPQEIAALRYGGMQILSSDPATFPSSKSLEPGCLTSDPPMPTLDGKPVGSTSSVSTSPQPPESSPVYSHDQARTDASDGDGRDNASVGRPPTSSQESEKDLRVVSQTFSSSFGYLSNRWNAGSSFSTPSTLGRGPDDSLRLESFPPSSCSSTASAPPILPPPQSQVRLSLSLEGKAEVVSNLPSPPRFQPPRPMSTIPTLPQVRPRPFQRSQSALPGITLPPISALTNSLPPTLARGRSRDAHAWELCCDADAQDELTIQAENESNGSAVAAISLLRSTSSVLQSNGSKRNAPPSRPAHKSQHAKKPRLSRTYSSVARMQTDSSEMEKLPLPIRPEDGTAEGKLKVSMLVLPSGDSDKENWSPDEDGNPQQWSRSRRPLPVAPQLPNPRRANRILQEHHGPALLAGSRANTAPVPGHRGSAKDGQDLEIFEDAENRRPAMREDEMERFMRGEVSPSKKGDVDCVAGLLALSQGNWR